MTDPTPRPRAGSGPSFLLRSPGLSTRRLRAAALTAAPLLIATAGLFPSAAQAATPRATALPPAGEASGRGCRLATDALGPDNPQHKPPQRPAAGSATDVRHPACRPVVVVSGRWSAGSPAGPAPRPLGRAATAGRAG